MVRWRQQPSAPCLGTGDERGAAYTDYHWAWKVLAYKGLIKGKAASYSLKSADHNDNGLVFMLWDGQQNVYTDPPVPGVWDGEWHHAVGTYDGERIRLYVDGALASNLPWSGKIEYVLDDHVDHIHDDFVIGIPNEDEMEQDWQYRGDIDEVQVWDRALSAKEVARLTNPTTGKKSKR